ncbi:arylamine N-acetyltransferase family protein [Halosolutus halophilus]|uniref:arylamine N-acetyltransferase family protein n=1 Tax=Halosolutus halophilus TaxID=1552990 RepID=UPI0022350CCF|nr:arylamine N-acetyltransferase [Halosolutus halophilus]
MVSRTHARYLDRIGLDPDRRPDRDGAALERLQRAHVTSVPFETLAVAGDPFDRFEGDGISVQIDPLYEKIVERRRGGFCYELNSLFAWLLDGLGFDVDAVAARVVSDGEPGLPAAHRSTLVTLSDGRRYVVDVGMGTPTMRRPIALSGDREGRVDEAGVEWRVVERDRPDADFATQYREPGDEAWTDRYVFATTPRDSSYFAATPDHLVAAPESPFTGDPVVSMATDRGHVKLRPDAVIRTEGRLRCERSIGADEWDELLDREFGIEPGST